MEKSPPSEAHICLASREIPHFNGTPDEHKTTTDSIVSNINPYTIYKINFKDIFPSTSRSPSFLLPLDFVVKLFFI